MATTMRQPNGEGPAPGVLPETLPAIGQVAPRCPTCDQPFKKKPARKTRCPHCGTFCYVRTRPCDRQRVLVTEAQIVLIEEQWALVNRTHAEFLARQREIIAVRAALAAQFGHEPSAADLQWTLHNTDLGKHALQGNWGLYRNTRLQMADLLRREGRMRAALATYLEILYLDANGPQNTSGARGLPWGERVPPFEPARAMVAPGIVSQASRLIQALNLLEEEVRALFAQMAEGVYGGLKLPVSPEQVWRMIGPQLETGRAVS